MRHAAIAAITVTLIVASFLIDTGLVGAGDADLARRWGIAAGVAFAYALNALWPRGTGE